MKQFLALLLAFTMGLSLVACGGEKAPEQASSQSGAATSEVVLEEDEQPGADAPIAELKTLNGKVYGEDYTALYQQFGKDVTIADVIEDEETGTAYIVRDGKRHTLGLDFLSRAMVYNTTVPEGGEWADENDVYADWWRLYITRWNQMLPEIPLYTNEYYDLYNAQIKGVTEFPTNPYWTPAQALIDWTSEKKEKNIILGASTELSGKFRFAAFGATSPGSSDHDVQKLITGLGTIAQTVDGNYVWNDTVVAEHKEVTNEDGSLTYTIKLHDDLKFSDGSPITAKNYLAETLVFSTPVGAQAASKDHMAGMKYVGFEEFNVYTGAGSPAEMPLKDADGNEVKDADGNVKTIKTSKVFSGLRLLDDLTFSATIDAEYLPYFYALTYADFQPQPLGLYLDKADIKDDGEGVYLTDDFYAMNGDKYALASHIFDGAWNTNNDYPYSGMYTVERWNNSDKSVVLALNPEFKGDYRGHKPTIEKVVYKRTVLQTQLEDFKSGGIDVLMGVTGGDSTNEAIALADSAPDKYVYTSYSRAGYGKLAFRADFGPVQFPEVRQAIAYCMDRAKFAKDFTGGYGGVVDGPYYSGSWMYKEAVKDGMMLNAYATSADTAIKVLEEGGWVYNEKGEAYTSGIRYKKIPAAEMDERDITFQSKDGSYKTTKVGDDYYMPLCLNWYGTQDNDFSDLLMTGFLKNDNLSTAGFNVQYTLGDFNPMIDELSQAAIYGFYQGTPLYTCFNLATGYNSAVYDYSYNLTIDPDEFDNYSLFYIKDEADAYWFE